MKINELQLKKDLIGAEEPFGQGFDPDKITDIFAKNKWNLLGKPGMEGAVAEHPTKDMVLKIFVRGSKYRDFLSMVQKNPSPHFPKFHKFTKDVPGTKFSYVLMEKLKHISGDDLEDYYLPYLYVIEVESSKVGITGLTGKFGAHIYGVLYDFIEENADNPYSSLVWNEFSTEKPDAAWFQAVTTMCQTAKSLGLTKLDLHPGNFMVRGNVLVITDPFFAPILSS